LIEKEIELEKIKVGAQSLELSTHSQSFSHGNGVKYAKLPKLPVFQSDKDNIDAYLQRFERFAENAKWERDSWSINLSDLLSGTALEVYSRLSPAEALDYDRLKLSLLQRFQLTEEGFHNKLRRSKPETGENPTQFVARLENYLARWMELASAHITFEGLRICFYMSNFLLVAIRHFQRSLKSAIQRMYRK